MAKKQKAVAPPADLIGDARARWLTAAPRLAVRGPIDTDLLKTYCQVWARWRQAEDGIARSGQLMKKASGRIGPSPLVAIANQAAKEVRSLETRLGLGLEVPAGEPAAAGGDDSLLTRRELATAMSVHMQTITKWEHDGLPIAERGRKGKPSRYRELDARTWLAARETAAKQTSMVDVAQERARKERAQAVLAEQTYQMRQRKLLPADEVERVWAAELTAVRAIILASYATHADQVFRVAIAEGVEGVERALRDLANEVLRELADPNRPPQQPSGDGALKVVA